MGKSWLLWRSLLFAEIVMAMGIVLWPHLPRDFNDFWQAALLMRQGHSPYEWPRYFSPIWLAVSVVPLTILPFYAAYILWSALTLGAFVIAMRRYSQDDRLAIVAGLAPFWMLMVGLGNMDSFVLFGSLLPPPIGIWFVLSKPQLGWVVALLWLWRLIQKCRPQPQRLISFLVPVGIGLTLSLAAGMRVPNPEFFTMWSADAFPVGLMLGMPLLILAMQWLDEATALAAALLMSPYVAFASWMAILPAALKFRNAPALSSLALAGYGVIWLVTPH